MRALVLAAVMLAGCAHAPRPALRTLLDLEPRYGDVRLGLAHAQRNATFELRNTSDTRIEFCLVDESVSVFAQGPDRVFRPLRLVGGTFDTTCARLISLAPHEATSFEASLGMPKEWLDSTGGVVLVALIRVRWHGQDGSSEGDGTIRSREIRVRPLP